ncbi:ABC transporter substrate-binding protein [Sphingomonas sp. LB-2]|uniref:ABC transporter substrate-binding protein n=1 Tax=Sphingomonas caeni TaxID=2984949 RepID=UPI00223045EB|nr:ABC transporter substrate-binding protein [Sphingomonas caeni]MCW3845696.1 ABC transporter substrate-binding protein [Sphingomonas caeni]
MTRPFLAVALALALGGCGGDQAKDAPIRVSVIGDSLAIADTDTGPLKTSDRVMMGAVAQGLVRFDASGQIEPGLAERWTVTKDGRSYIFRLRDAEWPGGQPVTAAEVVRVLRRAIAPGSRNPLAPFLVVIDEIVEMTPQVIEVRLSRPRPDLLKLFAQPELAIYRAKQGTGPFTPKNEPRGGVLLSPADGPVLIDDDEDKPPRPGSQVRLRGERAALAISRFKDGGAEAVIGGSFADWPVLRAAQVPDELVRIDPALGLFGLAVVSRQGFLADAGNRAALAMAIDRAAVTQAIRPDWQPVETLLPAQLDSASIPTQPAWGPLPLDARRENARAQVRTWQRAHPGMVVVRIALPRNPGGTLVWSAVARSLLSVGISVRRVGLEDDADLRLIDAVAPYDSGRWFLVTACQLCSEDSATLIATARDAPDLYNRAHRIAEADAMLTADSAYIPIAQPFRWAIVTARLNGWQGNSRAWHPLNHLMSETE